MSEQNIPSINDTRIFYSPVVMEISIPLENRRSFRLQLQTEGVICELQEDVIPRFRKKVEETTPAQTNGTGEETKQLLLLPIGVIIQKSSVEQSTDDDIDSGNEYCTYDDLITIIPCLENVLQNLIFQANYEARVEELAPMLDNPEKECTVPTPFGNFVFTYEQDNDGQITMRMYHRDNYTAEDSMEENLDDGDMADDAGEEDSELRRNDLLVANFRFDAAERTITLEPGEAE